MLAKVTAQTLCVCVCVQQLETSYLPKLLEYNQLLLRLLLAGGLPGLQMCAGSGAFHPHARVFMCLHWAIQWWCA